MTIVDIIKKRKSSRSYNNKLVKADDLKAIEDFISLNNRGVDNDTINIVIRQKQADGKQLKINYGLVSGQTAYMLGKVKSSVLSRVSYGYVMEKAVLKATELGIFTCWIGYFDVDYFSEIKLEDGYEIPSIIIMGYADKSSFYEKIARYSAKASTRNDWNQLFFDFKTGTALTSAITGKYSESLEMLRLAPSSGNTQPWRVYYDNLNNEFHFYKKVISKRYEAMGLHDIDMGIGMSHFEIVSVYNGLSGKWEVKNKMENRNDQYIITWRGN